MKKRFLFLSAAMIFIVLNCAGAMPAGKVFSLHSKSFTANGRLPDRLARPQAGGKNISPGLAWEAVPAGTRSLALLCVDLHPVARRWVHWLVINLPADCDSLAEGASLTGMPEGCRELDNSFGTPGWGGPQPPPGSGDHEYSFTLYALRCEKLPTGIRTAGELQAAIRGQVLGQATLNGWFGR